MNTNVLAVSCCVMALAAGQVRNGSAATMPATNLAAHAKAQARALPDKSYRFVWVIPTDVTTNQQSTIDQINRSVRVVQQWFGKQAGKTFQVNPLEIINGDHDRAWYAKTGNDGQWNSIHNAVKEVFRKEGTYWGDQQHPYRYVVYISTEGPGGANGPPPFVGLTQMDIDGMTATNWNTRWTGGLAHEIGHTLGLPHQGDDDKDVMRFGYLNLQAAYLSSTNINQMIDSPVNKGWLLEPQTRGDYRIKK